MSVALQVLVLVVAIVVAVAGLGVTLALRLSSRQRLRQRRLHQHEVQKAVARGGAVKATTHPTAKAAAPPASKSATKPATKPADTARHVPPVRDAAPATSVRTTPTPAVPLDPEQAHKAKLAALQAMLALGDERAEREAKSGKVQFADTQPLDDLAAAAPSAGRSDAAKEISLLDLDRVPAPSPRPAR